MAKALRNRFRCVIVQPHGQTMTLCTGIMVDVPAGLTRTQAIDYVAGRIGGEVARYAASEALGFGPIDGKIDWNEIVT